MEPSYTEELKKALESVKGLCVFYRATERTILRYRARGAPLEDPVKLRDWLYRQASAPDGIVARLEELLGEGGAGEETAGSDQDWGEFERQARSENPQEVMAKIAKARDWAFFKWERAGRTKNRRDEKFYSDLLAKMEGTLHDAQLRAKKLGMETGELYPAADLIRIGRAAGFWLTAMADGTTAQITAGLLALGASPDRDSVRQIVEAAILGDRVLAPLVRATQVNAGVKLPTAFVDAFKDGVAACIENGAEEFDRMYATEPNKPFA